jgi:hypothetical protein
MKLIILGAVAALSISCFEPPAAFAQSPTYLRCIKACRSQGCKDDCENAENARRNAHPPRGTIQMKCTWDERTHSQNCHP